MNSFFVIGCSVFIKKFDHLLPALLVRIGPFNGVNKIIFVLAVLLKKLWMININLIPQVFQ